MFPITWPPTTCPSLSEREAWRCPSSASVPTSETISCLPLTSIIWIETTYSTVKGWKWIWMLILLTLYHTFFCWSLEFDVKEKQESFEEFAHQSSLEVKRYNKRQVQDLLYFLLWKRQFTFALLHLYSENRYDKQTSREVILCTWGREGGNSLQCTIESSRVMGRGTKTA